RTRVVRTMFLQARKRETEGEGAEEGRRGRKRNRGRGGRGGGGGEGRESRGNKEVKKRDINRAPFLVMLPLPPERRSHNNTLLCVPSNTQYMLQARLCVL